MYIYIYIYMYIYLYVYRHIYIYIYIYGLWPIMETFQPCMMFSLLYGTPYTPHPNLEPCTLNPEL